MRQVTIPAVIAVAFWLVSFGDAPGTPTIAPGPDGGQIVQTVPVGGDWWAYGVRPGMSATPWPTDEHAAPGYEIWLGERTVGLSAGGGPPQQEGVHIGALAWVGAMALGRLRLPGAALLQVVAVSVPLLSVHALIGLPASLPLLAFPPAIATLSIPFRDTSTRAGAIGAAGIGASLFIGIWLGSGPAVDWRLAWLAPGAIGLAVVMLSALFQLRQDGDTSLRLERLVPVIAESRLAGRDEERRSIAGEVHDEVLPQLRRSQRDLDEAGHVGVEIGLGPLTESIRGLMNDRQLVVLEAAGLQVAAQNFVEGLARRGENVKIRTVGDPGMRAPEHVEAQMYRICQAAVDNALRHAEASSVDVVVSVDADEVELIVTDDGRGADAARLRHAARHGHLGVTEMRQRASRVGASLAISTDDGGTRVRVHWRP